jgi:hypothetical protein
MVTRSAEIDAAGSAQFRRAGGRRPRHHPKRRRDQLITTALKRLRASGYRALPINKLRSALPRRVGRLTRYLAPNDQPAFKAQNRCEASHV